MIILERDQGGYMTLEEFAAQYPNIIFAGDVPPRAILSRYGLTLKVAKRVVKPTVAVNQEAVLEDRPYFDGSEWRIDWRIIDVSESTRRLEADEALRHSYDQAPLETKAIIFLLADLWQKQNPGMTIAQARSAIRDRLKTHIDQLRGL